MKKIITLFLIIAVIVLIFSSLFKVYKSLNIDKNNQLKNNTSMLKNIPKEMKYLQPFTK